MEDVKNAAPDTTNRKLVPRPAQSIRTTPTPMDELGAPNAVNASFNYSPQTNFSKVMFSQVSVCPQVRCLPHCMLGYTLPPHPRDQRCLVNFNPSALAWVKCAHVVMPAGKVFKTAHPEMNHANCRCKTLSLQNENSL